MGQIRCYSNGNLISKNKLGNLCYFFKKILEIIFLYKCNYSFDMKHIKKLCAFANIACLFSKVTVDICKYCLLKVICCLIL